MTEDTKPAPAQSISRRTTTDDGTPLDPSIAAAPATDVGEIWRAAVVEYERITGVALTSLGALAEPLRREDTKDGDGTRGRAADVVGDHEAARDIEGILSQVKTTENRFRRGRHDGSKLDRFRTLLRSSLGPIDKLRSVVSHAAKAVGTRPFRGA